MEEDGVFMNVLWGYGVAKRCRFRRADCREMHWTLLLPFSMTKMPAVSCAAALQMPKIGAFSPVIETESSAFHANAFRALLQGVRTS